MFSGKALTILLFSLTGSCYVSSMEEPVITRDTYDLLHYSNCNNFDCGEIDAVRFDDRRLCRCRCKAGYLAYRDPAVQYNHRRKSYDFSEGIRKCVWHGAYREGCHYLRLGQKLGSFHAPTILDLTTSGNIELSREGVLSPERKLCVEPFVHIPGENRWKKIEDVNFGLMPVNEEKTNYTLSWRLRSHTNIYAYQGLVLKLNFSECSHPMMVFCLIAKAAGTYSGNGNCKQRSTTGRCCIFPFVYNNVVHKSCVSSSDMPEGKWCAVSLNTSIDKGNHKWREYCSMTSTTASPDSTRPLSKRPPMFHTPPPRRQKKTTSRQSTTRPHRAKPPKVSGHPVARITVTVTRDTCKGSSKVAPTPAPGEGSGDSRVNAGMIVGILLGILAFLIIIALLTRYLRRKKCTKKKRVRPKKSMSREDLAESSYSSIYSNSSRGATGNHLNHGYQQSIELSQEKAAVVRRSYLRDSQTSSSHFYDSIENKSPPDTGPSYPIYSMPEADYSLIIEKRQTKIDNVLPPVLPVMLKRKNHSKHLYSVLERNNDPLKNPEPTDNDTVFVEANPIYASTPRYRPSESNDEHNEGGYAEVNPLYGATAGFNRNNPPPLPPRLYDDPLDILSSRNDPPEANEKDV